MKNRNRYKDEAFEKWLTSSLESLKEKVKITSSTSYATRNLPELLGDHMSTYWEEFHFAFQTLINEVNTKLQFKTTVNETLQSNQQAQKDANEHNNDLAKEQKKEAELIEKAKSNKPANRYIRWIIGICVAAICLFEGILAIPVFEKWGLNLAESIVLSLLFAGVLAIFAHLVPRIIRFGKTIWQRRLIALGLFIFSIILFKYMADERVEYINRSTHCVDCTPISPYPFVIASTLLLVVAVAISYFYTPSAEELMKMKEYKETTKDLKDTQDKINGIKNKAKTNESNQAEFVNSSGSILVFGDSLEQMIINHAYQCYSLFKTTNLVHRTDGSKPSCFLDEYPFKFTTYFHSINTLLNENNDK